MYLGRIIGNVVCTMKDPALAGQKLAAEDAEDDLCHQLLAQ